MNILVLDATDGENTTAFESLLTGLRRLDPKGTLTARPLLPFTDTKALEGVDQILLFGGNIEDPQSMQVIEQASQQQVPTLLVWPEGVPAGHPGATGAVLRSESQQRAILDAGVELASLAAPSVPAVLDVLGALWFRADRPGDSLLIKALVQPVLAAGAKKVLLLGPNAARIKRALGSGIQASIAGLTEEVEPPFDAVIWSNMELSTDLVGALEAVRLVLAEDGIAVLGLANAAHFARSVIPGEQQPEAIRPDDWYLALRETGLEPNRVIVPTAGFGPATPDGGSNEHRTDGGGPMSAQQMLHLAHHWVAVVNAAPPTAGPMAIKALVEDDRVPEALSMAVAVVDACPWSPRAWSDLGVINHVMGNHDGALECLQRAYALGPDREDVRANLEALGGTPIIEDAITAVMANPDNGAAWDALIEQLARQGRKASVQALQTLRALRPRADRALA